MEGTFLEIPNAGRPYEVLCLEIVQVNFRLGNFEGADSHRKDVFRSFFKHLGIQN